MTLSFLLQDSSVKTIHQKMIELYECWTNQQTMTNVLMVTCSLPLATAAPHQHLLKPGVTDIKQSMILTLHGLFYTSVYSETDSGR